MSAQVEIGMLSFISGIYDIDMTIFRSRQSVDFSHSIIDGRFFEHIIMVRVYGDDCWL